MGKPGYYIQVELGISFAAVGCFFQPQPEIFAQVVGQEIDYNGDKLKKIVNEKKLKANFEKCSDEDALKNAPKGKDKDHERV